MDCSFITFLTLHYSFKPRAMLYELFTHSLIFISYILITFSIKWKLPKHVTKGWTCILFDSVSLLLEPNQIERKTDQAIYESPKFHLSLPLSRAALVPLWAMALQSVREALSQDFPFPPQRLKCWSPQISSVPLLSSAASLRSKVQVLYRRFIGTWFSARRRRRRSYKL